MGKHRPRRPGGQVWELLLSLILCRSFSPASLEAAIVARIERIDEIPTILRELRAGEMESLELLEAILEDG